MPLHAAWLFTWGHRPGEQVKLVCQGGHVQALGACFASHSARALAACACVLRQAGQQAAQVGAAGALCVHNSRALLPRGQYRVSQSCLPAHARALHPSSL